MGWSSGFHIREWIDIYLNIVLEKTLAFCSAYVRFLFCTLRFLAWPAIKALGVRSAFRYTVVSVFVVIRYCIWGCVSKDIIINYVLRCLLGNRLEYLWVIILLQLTGNKRILYSISFSVTEKNFCLFIMRLQTRTMMTLNCFRLIHLRMRYSSISRMTYHLFLAVNWTCMSISLQEIQT